MSSQETVVVTQWTVGSGRQTYTILGDHQSMQSRRGRPVFDHYRKPGSQIINLRVIPHPFGLILIRRTNSRSKATKQEDKSEALSGLIWTHLPASSRTLLCLQLCSHPLCKFPSFCIVLSLFISCSATDILRAGSDGHLKGTDVNQGVRTVSLLVNWCFEPSQPLGILSGLKETFIERCIVERTDMAEIRQEELSEKTESCRENFME